MGLMGSSMKSIMWSQGLPPQEHVDAMHAVEFLLNRFPTVSVSACDPPDGHILRSSHSRGTCLWSSHLGVKVRSQRNSGRHFCGVPSDEQTL